MKALSIMPYPASLIASGEKVEEYRVWQTEYRGDLLVCASSRNEGPDLVRGQAICVVELYDIRKDGDRDFAWLIRNVRFIEPFPVKGKLHLYDVDDDKIVYLTKKKGRKTVSISFDEAVDYWHELGLIRDLTPAEIEKYYEPVE